MAALLPLSFLMCTVLVIAVVLFGFATFANEKKYLAMIQRMIEPAGTSKRGEPEETGTVQQDTPPAGSSAALPCRR
jgi:hypothetical protein